MIAVPDPLKDGHQRHPKYPTESNKFCHNGIGHISAYHGPNMVLRSPLCMVLAGIGIFFPVCPLSAMSPGFLPMVLIGGPLHEVA